MVVVKKGLRGKAVQRGLKRRPPPKEDIELSSEEEDEFTIDEPEEKKFVIAESSDEDEGHDSDKELQIALRDGLLKPGLNYVMQKKRPIINKKAEILDKVATFAKKLPWVETVDVTTQSELTKDIINNDFEREMQFYKQAERAVQIAVPKLLALGVKVIRPPDYYAQMAKDDNHMQKVRHRLLKIQEGKERQEAIRRMREEKKFATKVQKQRVQEKSNEKKKLMEAVKKHKKGMKQQLEDMLNNVKRYNLDQDDDKPQRGNSSSNGKHVGGGPNNRSKNFKRQFKQTKYGYGGKKKGQKRNTKESFESVFGKGGGKEGRGGGRAGGRGGLGGRGGKGRR